jgi:hypothetical protein
MEAKKMIGKTAIVVMSAVAVLALSSSGAATDEAVSEQQIGYRVELTGTPGMKFRLRCRTLEDGHAAYRPHFNVLPRTYEYPVDSLSCVLWKKEHNGEMQIRLVALYPTKERVIGSASSQDYPAAIFARSSGPWGPEVVVPAVNHDLVMPPTASASTP